ncbi:hypothetical protein FPQ18DRAFT_288150 [Pyronema domesticum]|uniref:Uncharacterized protein n=1 Tax=Pyronema omphalodes (strain CBS 100304) TaxID=1076935 RepID=U4LPS2_PYROM|nr:hypothetical protein FPQ18DRAFT_288150 [Pyronema domesticum]CCX33950.1 Similar to hypothetical protein RO3G_11308 [Rhizopus oryzae RA 99-880]; acc. no. EIE86597 [Pyronema omphalodes CBS 100304]
MKLNLVISTLLLFVASVWSQDRGSYTIPGLGARKQAIIKSGGNSLDIAIAMLETDNMNAQYPYGDNKSQDSANFGIFKQNWFMIRSACSRFKGQKTAQWNNGAALNSNLGADIFCRHQSQEFYGFEKWFGGHRNGQSGISNPNTKDINNYKSAVLWIQKQIDSNSKYRTDNTRFWVTVPAI